MQKIPVEFLSQCPECHQYYAIKKSRVDVYKGDFVVKIPLAQCGWPLLLAIITIPSHMEQAIKNKHPRRTNAKI
jgi:hypothetical protein